ncbi:VOC family protein [Evansella halocellulosilytica]|uniref:VOC family protein n=1 Tax=Evansella halocellulosilytica TaxID=2011013 RepID=UPI0027BAA338|nr:VOC family protein [Evansella halocellulosilytica]
MLDRKPDFIPHEGFAEWELIRGCWLQVAKGEPTPGSGPLRLGVTNIEKERTRVIEKLNVEAFKIYSREEVPVKWGTFTDPWGNRLGFYEFMDKEEQNERVKMVLQQ